MLYASRLKLKIILSNIPAITSRSVRFPISIYLRNPASIRNAG